MMTGLVRWVPVNTGGNYFKNGILRKSDSLDRIHAKAFNKDIVSEYFDMLLNTLTTNNLTNSPRQTYNCDETFLPNGLLQGESCRSQRC